MRIRILCGALLGLVALCGCGAEPPAAPPAPAERRATVLDPMLQQMDRAKQQATEMEQRKQQLDATLEAQER